MHIFTGHKHPYPCTICTHHVTELARGYPVAVGEDDRPAALTRHGEGREHSVLIVPGTLGPFCVECLFDAVERPKHCTFYVVGK